MLASLHAGFLAGNVTVEGYLLNSLIHLIHSFIIRSCNSYLLGTYS